MAEDVRTVLEGVARLMRSKDSHAAEKKCRGALARWPDDVNVTAMLGAILANKGELDEAENHLRSAIRMEPAFARPYEDLGVLYLARNNAETAIELLRKAVALDPLQVTAMRNLVAALQSAGRAEEAADLLNRQRGSAPVPVLLREAEALRTNGELAESGRVCDSVLKREPENVQALHILARNATDEERFVVAEGFLKRIVALLPNDARPLADLGRFLRDRSRYPEAVTALQAAAGLSTDNPEILSQLGNVLGILGRSEEALQAYENCLAIQPRDPAALIGRGHMLRTAGLTDDARQSYESCAEAHPQIGSAWWYLASLHRYAASDQDISVMQEQLRAGSVDPDSEVGFRFALARAFENRGRFDAAWEQYSLGNAGKRKLVDYDAARFERENERIKAVFSQRPDAGEAPPGPTPIFILGVPRSGSTLVEQILASHSEVEGGGESPTILTLTSTLAGNSSGSLRYPEIVQQLAAGELTRLGRKYLDDAVAHCGQQCRYFTDKMPANFPHVGFIQRILPHAKIIDARRDPMAACVANYRQLFAQGKNQAYDLSELAQYYLRYVDIMQHWDKVLPETVLHVQYEDVVADLDGQVRRILAFCSLPYESSCVEFHKSQRAVNTASAEQVREPIYVSAVDFWKNYEPYLDRLRAELAPLLQDASPDWESAR